MDRAMTYNLIYALAARDGREAALFGGTAPLAREAFARGLCSSPAFPELWFELPLAGTPWFDLHMLVARPDMDEGASFAGLGGAYASALSWFARAKGVRQLALSFDTGAGDASRPAVQLLMAGRSVAVAEGFLAAAGRPDLVGAYRTFIHRMPSDWYACYLGSFPGRADGPATSWVRVECIVGRDCQRAYASDAGVLAEQLARLGVGALDETLLPRIRELARSPFPLELQFDVGEDGRALPVLSASLRFGADAWRAANAPDGAARLFRLARDWGLADGRWRELANTAFATRVALGGESAQLWCYPAFIKLRWREGRPPDAKAYLIAGAG